MEKQSPIWKKVLAVLFLWGMALAGGSIVVSLANFFAPLLFHRDSFEQGSLGFIFLTVISGGVGVIIAAHIMERLTSPHEYMFRIINYVVLSAVIATLIFVFGVMGMQIVFIWQGVLIISACFYYIYDEYTCMKKHESQQE